MSVLQAECWLLFCLRMRFSSAELCKSFARCCHFLLSVVLGMVKSLPQVTQREEQLMRHWRKEGRSIPDIMALTRRCKKTVYDHIGKAHRVGQFARCSRARELTQCAKCEKWYEAQHRPSHIPACAACFGAFVFEGEMAWSQVGS